MNKVTIHFLYPNKDGKVVSGPNAQLNAMLAGSSEGGVFAVACEPRALLPPAATGEPEAVTCEKCKGSDAWKNAMKALKEERSGNAPLVLADEKREAQNNLAAVAAAQRPKG